MSSDLTGQRHKLGGIAGGAQHVAVWPNGWGDHTEIREPVLQRWRRVSHHDHIAFGQPCSLVRWQRHVAAAAPVRSRHAHPAAARPKAPAAAQPAAAARPDASIARYLATLDRADREDSDVTEAKVGRIKEKIAGLRRQMQFLKDMERQVEAAPEQQVSLTDPDARSMATSGRGTGIVGYNVQTAVDTQYHLIVAHELTNAGHNRTQPLTWDWTRSMRRAARGSPSWLTAATSTAIRCRRARTPANFQPKSCFPTAPVGCDPTEVSRSCSSYAVA